jgi:hypothetical protein
VSDWVSERVCRSRIVIRSSRVTGSHALIDRRCWQRQWRSLEMFYNLRRDVNEEQVQHHVSERTYRDTVAEQLHVGGKTAVEAGNQDRHVNRSHEPWHNASSAEASRNMRTMAAVIVARATASYKASEQAPARVTQVALRRESDPVEGCGSCRSPMSAHGRDGEFTTAPGS